MPVNSTVAAGTPVAPMPSTSARLLTSPSLAPNTAARNEPASRVRPRAASPRSTSPWMRSSAAIDSRGVGIVVVRRARLGALGEGQHEQRAEVPGQEGQEARAQIAPQRLADVVAEQLEPVRLVAALGLGEAEQDLALLPLLALGQLAVDRGLGPLVGEVLAPPLHRGRLRPWLGSALRAPGVAQAPRTLPGLRPARARSGPDPSSARRAGPSSARPRSRRSGRRRRPSTCVVKTCT